MMNSKKKRELSIFFIPGSLSTHPALALWVQQPLQGALPTLCAFPLLEQCFRFPSRNHPGPSLSFPRVGHETQACPITAFHLSSQWASSLGLCQNYWQKKLFFFHESYLSQRRCRHDPAITEAELNEEGNTSQKREGRGRLPQMRPCLGKFLSISE